MRERVRDAAIRPVGELVRGPATVCRPDTSARDAARLMTARGTRYALLPLPRGEYGIVTEGDLRRRVLAADLDAAVPVSEVMTAPVHTVSDTTLGADALVTMIAHGVRLLPVLAGSGALLGVVEDADLLANATRGGFLVRTRIARAHSPDDLVAATAHVPALVADLTRARVAALDVTGILSAVMEAALARAIDLTDENDCTWLTLGSIARREAVPASDVDSATVWEARPDVAGATRVHALLSRGGLRSDDNGAIAARPRFARTVDEWRDAVDDWLADPWEDQALVMLGMLVDSRAVRGEHDLSAHTAEALRAHPDTLRLLLREAVEDKARIRRRIVSRRAEPVDLKTHGLAPIVNIARWAGVAAGGAAESTPTRLRTAVDAGVLSPDHGRVLTESFDALTQIRLRHQCDQQSGGEKPTNTVDPELLSPLQRSLLSEAIREVAGVQRTLAYAGPPS